MKEATGMLVLAGVVLLLGGYLLYALVHPEKFCRYAEKFLTTQAEEI